MHRFNTKPIIKILVLTHASEDGLALTLKIQTDNTDTD